jgi:hypothetical protein
MHILELADVFLADKASDEDEFAFAWTGHRFVETGRRITAWRTPRPRQVVSHGTA